MEIQATENPKRKKKESQMRKMLNTEKGERKDEKKKHDSVNG